MKVKSEREVAQSCPTPSDPMDYSLPGSSVHGIFQARVLEWGAIAFSDLFLRYVYLCCILDSGLPWWLSGKDPPANAGDMGLIPGSGRPPGEGNGNTIQYSCLGNTMDRGAWWATVHGIAKELDITQRLKHSNI